MIFEEIEDGMRIWITHHDMMWMETKQFISIILEGRHMYRSHANADMDDDDSKKD